MGNYARLARPLTFEKTYYLKYNCQFTVFLANAFHLMRPLSQFDISRRRMTRVGFCILDYFNDTELVEISRRAALVHKQNNNEELQNVVDLKVDGISLYFFLKEISSSEEFRKVILKAQPLREKRFIIKVVPPEKEALDYKWNGIVSHSVWEKVEMDNLISWLSTLGGGFSALGETFAHHAETAGKISLKQLILGMKLGDPFLQSRCKLYYSISLIQTGFLRKAKYIIREQYEFAATHKESDTKLVNMCEGIWLKLQYSYAQRRSNKQKEICIEDSTCDNNKVEIS